MWKSQVKLKLHFTNQVKDSSQLLALRGRIDAPGKISPARSATSMSIRTKFSCTFSHLYVHGYNVLLHNPPPLCPYIQSSPASLPPLCPYVQSSPARSATSTSLHTKFSVRQVSNSESTTDLCLHFRWKVVFRTLTLFTGNIYLSVE